MVVNLVLTSIFKEFKITRDPLVFYTIVGSISVSLLLLLVTSGLIMNSFLFMIVVNILLFQYNAPFSIKTLQSKIILHYSYDRKVLYKYIIFICLKNNPMIIVACLFNFLVLILTLNNFYLFQAIIISFLLQIHIFIYQLARNSFIKVLQGLAIILIILLNIYSSNYLIGIISIGILVSILIIIKIFYKDTYLTFGYEINLKDRQINQLKFNSVNMYFNLFRGFLRRYSFKSYLMLLCASLLYISFIDNFRVDIDFSSILVFLYLFDLELLADQQFMEIDKTASKFHFMTLSPLNKISTFMLSEQFHRLTVYLVLLVGITVIDLSIKKVIGTLVVIVLMTFVGMTYFNGIGKLVKGRKKSNTIFFQYIIILIIISTVALKNLFLS